MRLLLALTLLLAAPAALAQKDDHAHHRRADSLIDRADSTHVPTGLTSGDVTGLMEGHGMGLAKAAELNHYPGPKHVLELAAELDLTDVQRAEAERLRAEMLAEAQPLGAQIVEMERHLDALFAEGRATPDTVDRITSHIAEAKGRLRATHLRAHVAMQAALTPDQIAAYDRLRGHTD